MTGRYWHLEPKDKSLLDFEGEVDCRPGSWAWVVKLFAQCPKDYFRRCPPLSVPEPPEPPFPVEEQPESSELLRRAEELEKNSK